MSGLRRLSLAGPAKHVLRSLFPSGFNGSLVLCCSRRLVFLFFFRGARVLKHLPCCSCGGAHSCFFLALLQLFCFRRGRGRLVGGRRVGVAACFAGCVGRGTLMGVLVLGGCFGSAGVAGLAPGYGVRAPVVGVLAVWGGR